MYTNTIASTIRILLTILCVSSATALADTQDEGSSEVEVSTLEDAVCDMFFEWGELMPETLQSMEGIFEACDASALEGAQAAGAQN